MQAKSKSHLSQRSMTFVVAIRDVKKSNQTNHFSDKYFLSSLFCLLVRFWVGLFGFSEGGKVFSESTGFCLLFIKTKERHNYPSTRWRSTGVNLQPKGNFFT